MSDLAGFVADRLAEDEAAAKAAPGQGKWHATTADSIADAAVFDDIWRLTDAASYQDWPEGETYGTAMTPEYIEKRRDELVAHIARWDPARVLREVEAKRRILAVHAALDGVEGCETCEYPIRWPCPTVRALTAVWSDHSDYDPEWR